jgi:hypothetical protein
VYADPVVDSVQERVLTEPNSIQIEEPHPIFVNRVTSVIHKNGNVEDELGNAPIHEQLGMDTVMFDRAERYEDRYRPSGDLSQPVAGSPLGEIAENRGDPCIESSSHHTRPVAGSSEEEIAENRVDVLPVNETPESERKCIRPHSQNLADCLTGEFCSICKEYGEQPKEWISTVNCPDGHVFHLVCMTRHLKSSNECPNCRSAITELRDHYRMALSPPKGQCSMCKNDLHTVSFIFVYL